MVILSLRPDTKACCRGQSQGWMAPVAAAPVFLEHTPSPHTVTFPCHRRNLPPPPPGLEIPEVPEAVAGNLRFGVGSFGHPHFCTRPCVYISKGRVCPCGTACAYCHFPHRATSKPDWKLRQRLLAANDQELLATFLPFIFKKAAMEGLIPYVDHLLALLKAEMHETQSEAIALGRFRPLRMNFMRLGCGFTA